MKIYTTAATQADVAVTVPATAKAIAHVMRVMVDVIMTVDNNQNVQSQVTSSERAVMVLTSEVAAAPPTRLTLRHVHVHVLDLVAVLARALPIDDNPHSLLVNHHNNQQVNVADALRH
eukprot:m.45003 g.45003  ORF g.45003 m.45003 type:complete len:118 (+) comp19842_c1_seq1:201-554(+)